MKFFKYAYFLTGLVWQAALLYSCDHQTEVIMKWAAVYCVSLSTFRQDQKKLDINNNFCLLQEFIFQCRNAKKQPDPEKLNPTLIYIFLSRWPLIMGWEYMLYCSISISMMTKIVFAESWISLEFSSLQKKVIHFIFENMTWLVLSHSS